MGSTQCTNLRKAVAPTQPQPGNQRRNGADKKQRTNHEKPFQRSVFIWLRNLQLPLKTVQCNTFSGEKTTEKEVRSLPSYQLIVNIITSASYLDIQTCPLTVTPLGRGKLSLTRRPYTVSLYPNIFYYKQDG